MTNPTYDEIVDSWELWAEYAAPMGTREEFGAMTREDRLAMMHECFGPETQTTGATMYRVQIDDERGEWTDSTQAGALGTVEEAREHIDELRFAGWVGDMRIVLDDDRESVVEYSAA